MTKWYYRYIDGTKIKFDLKHPPFTPEAWKMIQLLKVDFVATINGEVKAK